MVVGDVISLNEFEIDSVTATRSPAAAATPGLHAELLFDLFGAGIKPMVCCFIAPRSADGTAPFCREIAGELAESQGGSEARIALLAGDMLLAGRSLEELEPFQGSTSASAPCVWHWPERNQARRAQVPASLALQEMLQGLRSRFDYVLIDCPPVSASGMAVALAAMADRTVLLIPRGGVRRAEIQSAQRALVSRGAPLFGCVLFGDAPAEDRPIAGRRK